MIEMLVKGGWMMLPLVACSLIAVTIVIERILYFRNIGATSEAQHMLTLVRQGKYTDALSVAERRPAPLLRVLAAGVQEREGHPSVAMEAQSHAELAAMRRGLVALDTVITLAPLLGLLGTIIGMIQSFGIMASSGLGQPHAVTGGVAEALIATASGIAVAVSSLVPYNYFLARVERETEYLEEYATRVELVLAWARDVRSL